MHDLLPEGEDIRRAVRWVSGMSRDFPERPVPRLVQEAILRFDLSPRDAEFLMGLFRRENGDR